MGKPPVSKATPKSAKSAAAALSGTEVANVNVPVGALALPSGFKAKRMVTMPSLNLKTGEGRSLYVVDAIRVSKVVDKEKKTDGSPKREPANICTVDDVVTGESFIFLVPKVVQANLERDYPNEGYVGKTFYVENIGKRTETQRYFDFRIVELEADETTQ